jgi:hypothetical protein
MYSKRLLFRRCQQRNKRDDERMIQFIFLNLFI